MRQPVNTLTPFDHDRPIFRQAKEASVLIQSPYCGY
jgi:hypothetical protein